MVRAKGRDRGAAAVETALVLPILLLVIFGIIDFGRMLNAQITLTEAAREGARAEALDADPADRVNAVANGLGTVATIVAEECTSSPTAGQDAAVTVTYTFSFVTPVAAIASLFAGDGLDGEVAMAGTGVMPCRA